MGNTVLSTRMAWDTLRFLAEADISGTYAFVGTFFSDPVRILTITNDTNALLTFTDDPTGAVDKFVIPAYTARIWDMSTNQAAPAKAIFLPQNTIISVKGTPSAGTGVYIEILYGAN
jgi:hypothetical protein